MIDLRKPYATYITCVERLIEEEVDRWPWLPAPEMKRRVASFLKRPGKRLRPLLSLICARLFNSSPARACHAAAALEIYHTATLIYDDIQDNSEFRRGLPCAHVSTSTSTAMNQAAVTRSLTYHLIYQDAELDSAEKLEIHHLLDQAALLVALGQSIDIGWHEGWYTSYADFPYLDMIDGKTGALFRCAAAIGGVVGHAPTDVLNDLDSLGKSIGRLFQMMDDYLDLFGDPSTMGRPRYNDLREGKLTYPILLLLDELSKQGRGRDVAIVLERLAKRDAHETQWEWLIHSMRDLQIDARVRQSCLVEADTICARAKELGSEVAAQEHLVEFTRSIVKAAAG